jgi:hypothetical protein
MIHTLRSSLLAYTHHAYTMSGAVMHAEHHHQIIALAAAVGSANLQFYQHANH